MFDASNSTAITTTDSTAIKAAPGAGLAYSITDITVSNSHATVGTLVRILSGTTVKWQGYARQQGDGVPVSLKTELVCGANEAINAQCLTTGASVYVSISGYTRKS